MQQQLNDVLNNLGIAGECVRAENHRHLAFFDVKLAQKPGVRKKLEGAAPDIALHLKTKTIPTVTLVPEEGIVRIQAAMRDADMVGLNSLFKGEKVPTDTMVFPILLGEDDSGKKVWMDMNDNPHLIVSGATGSGKSCLLQVLIANALYLHEARFRNVWICLADPKRVEFSSYDTDLLKGQVMGVESTYDAVLEQLQLIYNTMEERYQKMNKIGMRNIKDSPNEFPLIFAIIDEVSDLMGQQGSDKKLEELLVKIAQKGRACGIYMVLSTQRPSVDVITGLIKANFPGRIACRTASRKDSEIVLDRPGAEHLLGKGDALLQNLKHSNVRFQVAYIEPNTVLNTVKRYRKHRNVG